MDAFCPVSQPARFLAIPHSLQEFCIARQKPVARVVAPVFDASVGRVLSAALANPDQVVAALCHGSASFLAAGDATSWAFKGYRMTAFTNAEETQTGLAVHAPWLLEDRLRAAGALFDGGAPWSSHVVVDGNLVTGQNPMSAEAATRALLDRLAARRSRNGSTGN
jgi:putative intracellular protease/amidase